jgi:uncharacterized RDD family membrane protein YckC
MFPEQDEPPTPPQPLFDKHTIETPEQTEIQFTLAGIGSRFLAIAIDTLIESAALVIAMLLFALLENGLAAIGVKSQWFAAVLIVFFFLLMYGYFAIFEIVWNGQTPGKRLAGIRVVKDSGRPLTPAEAIGRNLMRIVDQLPFLYAIGILTALLNSRNKRLGDLVVGSIVIRESSSKEMKPVWQMEQLAPAAAHLPFGADALSLEDLSLVDTFLNRRSYLTYSVRTRMAEEIVERLRPKLSIPGDASLSAESILDAVAYQRRATGGYS